MSTLQPSIRIGIVGLEKGSTQKNRAWGIWPTGYPAAVSAAGGVPVRLDAPGQDAAWEEELDDLHGVVLAGAEHATPRQVAMQEALLLRCRQRKLSLLAIDEGMLTLNSVFGGTCYLDLPHDLPEALQHRHPPGHGVRHAINVAPRTRLARLYGEGEIAVNSEHRQAVCRVARGFHVSARALDGVIEALEWDGNDWFALAVQWQPASATASGLDIQLFRGLVDECASRLPRGVRRPARPTAAPRRKARQLVAV